MSAPDSTYRSRKFILAFIAMAVSSVALMMKIIDGNAWFLSVGVILGLYGTANVMEKKQP